MLQTGAHAPATVLSHSDITNSRPKAQSSNRNASHSHRFLSCPGNAQSLLLPAGRNLIAPAHNVSLHRFGELLLKEPACKAACKAKGLSTKAAEMPELVLLRPETANPSLSQGCLQPPVTLPPPSHNAMPVSNHHPSCNIPKGLGEGCAVHTSAVPFTSPLTKRQPQLQSRDHPIPQKNKAQTEKTAYPSSTAHLSGCLKMQMSQHPSFHCF